jgi:excisionase family DNA binding protein
MTDEKLLTLIDVAKQLNVCRQAVYFALWRKKIRGDKVGRKWRFKQIYIEEYKLAMYSRSHNFKLDELSVKDSALLLKTIPQRVYYAIYRGRLKYSRNGGIIIIKKSDLVEYSKKFKQRRN